MLTARDTVGDRVTGLDAGADDYLVKPFAYEELAARLRALGRRGAGTRRPEPKLVAGPIVLEETARRVTLEGRTIDLSPREFSLLECLLRHPGQTLSRDQLLDQAWPFSVAVTPNAVDAYIHYLRDKLGSRGQADRDRPRGGLSSGRCLTGSSRRSRPPPPNWPPKPPTGVSIRARPPQPRPVERRNDPARADRAWPSRCTRPWPGPSPTRGSPSSTPG